MFFLPVDLQVGHATGAVHAGLLLLPLTAGLVLGSNATRRPDVPAR